MDTKRAAVAVILLLAVLAFLWVLMTYVFPSNTKGTGPSGSVTIYHSLISGMHEYSGVLALPTACESLAAAVSVAFVQPPKAHIQLTTNKTGDVCAQVITQNEFSVAVSSAEMPEVDVSLNGDPLSVSVVER